MMYRFEASRFYESVKLFFGCKLEVSGGFDQCHTVVGRVRVVY